MTTGPYKHLTSGVSFMIPFVTAGGLLIALSFALDGIYAADPSNAGTLGYSLFQVGAKAAFVLLLPVLAGYIAYSIADRPGLAPGMIGGLMCANLGAGFLGAIAAGFIAGYGTDWMNRTIRLPESLEGLKLILILPLLGTLLTGLLMIYVVGPPVETALAFLTNFLEGMQGSSAVILGLLLGGMMAVDMGGPVNKAAYLFAVGLLSSHVYTPMAAVMAAGMTPPLALALATRIFPTRFIEAERNSVGATAILGVSFITEGAIPFAARDPLRVIPAAIAGSAVAGAISMLAGVELKVPHGGLFVLPIPGAITHLVLYLIALIAGTIVTALLLGLLKRPVPREWRDRQGTTKTFAIAPAGLTYLNRVSMMGELAASLAHEIKQPIAGAVAGANACLLWLHHDPPDVMEACGAASRMVAAAKHAADIVDRVRSLYGRGTPQREVVDLNEILREMTVLLGDTADQHSISIRTDLDPELPRTTADRIQMQQVLMNLMLNGIEAMREAGGELTVASKRKEDGQALVSVSDSGIGLPVDNAERVFDAFFTTKPQGTGVGLSISRRIIDAHGGRLWASPNAGRGAVFQFTLPAEVTAAAPVRV